MATSKVSDLEFKRLSAAEIQRSSVEELKAELQLRGIPFNARDRKRDLQMKLCEALSIVINPSNLATEVVTLSEMDKTKADDGDVLSHSSRENSPARSMRSNNSKRKFYSNLTNEQIFELEKLILQTAQQTENKKLEAENHLEKMRLEAEIDLNWRKLDYQHTLDMAQAQNRPFVQSNVNTPVPSPTIVIVVIFSFSLLLWFVWTQLVQVCPQGGATCSLSSKIKV